MSVKTKFEYKILDDNIGRVNQILPHKNKWAWELYTKAVKNNWNPDEVGMSKDKSQWESDVITPDEKLLVKRCLGFFAGSESLVSNNLLINAYKYITDAECRQYISVQVKEEALHNHTIVHICASLNMDSKELYEAYSNIPAIKAKDDYLITVTEDLDIAAKNMDTSSTEFRQKILNNLIIYYLICEGVLFYSGFAMLLSLNQQNKLKGITEQIEYTVRDESLHVQFGTALINKIVEEYPELWTEEYKEKVKGYFDKAIELEERYAKDVLPRGILGLNAEMFSSYIKFVSNRRMAGINLPYSYGKQVNPFPWLSEAMDLRVCTNYFEGKAKEYQAGALVDDF